MSDATAPAEAPPQPADEAEPASDDELPEHSGGEADTDDGAANADEDA